LVADNLSIQLDFHKPCPDEGSFVFFLKNQTIVLKYKHPNQEGKR